MSNNESASTAMDIETAKAHSTVAVLLTLSGGFLDAFTYIGHGKVFANSMTGNIVLLAVNLAAGDWQQASRHILPLVGFGWGGLAAHLLQLIKGRTGSNLPLQRDSEFGRGGCSPVQIFLTQGAVQAD